MKTIEEEYQEYQVPKEIVEKMTHPYYLILYMDDFYKSVEKDERRLFRARRRNRLAQQVFFQSVEFFKEEEKVYNEAIKIADQNLDLVIGMVELVDENTFLELLKMLDFQVSHYVGNKNYIRAELDSIDQASRGIRYMDPRQRNTHPAVKKFLESKIEGMKTKKHLEKMEEI